jgi:hypothetical protein
MYAAVHEEILQMNPEDWPTQSKKFGECDSSKENHIHKEEERPYLM